jgi:hypothetical protein
LIYLLAAVAALALGPVAVSLAGRRPPLVPLLDGFVVVAIPGLVFFYFVPTAVEHGSVVPLAALLVGFLGPVVLERLTRDRRGRADRLALLLGLTGLALHAALDGAALVGLEASGGVLLGMAVVVHRLPVGLAVWWLVSSRSGSVPAVLALGGLMAVTVAGFLGGAGLVAAVGGEGVLLYQAAVGGSLVHVVFHRVHPSAEAVHLGRAGGYRWEGVGALAAASFLAGMVLLPAGPHAGHAHEGVHAFTAAMTSLAALGAPALLAAWVLGAALPERTMERLLPGPGPWSPVSGGGTRAPDLGLDALALSLPLLGLPLTLARLLTASWVVPAAAGWLRWKVGDEASPPRPDGGSGGSGPGGFVGRFRRSVDRSAPWVVVGLILAACLVPVLDRGELGGLAMGPGGAMVATALVGFPLGLSAGAATLVAAVLWAAGLPAGAVVAGLITAPAADVATLALVVRTRGAAVAVAFSAILLGSAVALGYGAEAVLAGAGVRPPEGLLALPPGPLRAPGPVEAAALALTVVALGDAVLRRGIRRLASTVRPGLGLTLGPHTHAHSHPHDPPS